MFVNNAQNVLEGVSLADLEQGFFSLGLLDLDHDSLKCSIQYRLESLHCGEELKNYCVQTNDGESMDIIENNLK